MYYLSIGSPINIIKELPSVDRIWVFEFKGINMSSLAAIMYHYVNSQVVSLKINLFVLKYEINTKDTLDLFFVSTNVKVED